MSLEQASTEALLSELLRREVAQPAARLTERFGDTHREVTFADGSDHVVSIYLESDGPLMSGRQQ